MKGGMTIKLSGLDDVVKQLKTGSKQAEKVLIMTGRDMKSRVPAKVAKSVRTVYNIPSPQITPTTKAQRAKGTRKAGSIHVKGATLTAVEIEYKGHRLSVARFGMTPKTPQEQTKEIVNTGVGPWWRRQRILKPIGVTIKKGQRKKFKHAFIGKTGARDKSKTPYIVFERTTEKPYPIKPIKTLALPQMIEDREVGAKIRKEVNDLVADRFDRQMKRYFKNK